MFIFLSFVFLVGCEAEQLEAIAEGKETFQDYCSGEPEKISGAYRIYQEVDITDDVGVLKRFRYYKVKNSESCYKQQMPLTYYEQGIRKRARLGIQCEPQTEITNEVFLKLSNNYYTYKNDKGYLHFDPDTGIYRRVYFGESKEGSQTIHSKELGCFWMRQDLENELWGAVDYGLQLYLDQPKSASSNVSKANEIYRIDSMVGMWQMTSFDQIGNWNYAFCPYLSTPWGFCNMLRNGDIMYHSPALSDTDKSNLLAEALLIRTKTNYLEITENEFEQKWIEAQDRENEEPHLNYKYAVKFNPDGPFYTEQAWIGYIKEIRPMMPEITIPSMRPVCYSGYQEVTLNDGSRSFIRGEICYIDGEYNFTEY